MMSTRAEVDGRRLRGDRTRRKILDAAILQASRSGLEGLTLGKLATEVGVSKGSITILFGDKEGLQLATLDAAVACFTDGIEDIRPGRQSPLEAVATLFRRWFEFVEQRRLPGGCFVHATLSEFRARPGLVQDRARVHRDGWRQAIVSLLLEARTSGELPKSVDIDQLAFELFACQAAADTATFYGDADTFAMARRTVEERLRPPRAKPTRNVTKPTRKIISKSAR
jgi:AcrR family transcriptional regulator